MNQPEILFSYSVGQPVKVLATEHVCQDFHGATGIITSRSITETECVRVNGDPTVLPLAEPYTCYTVEFMDKSLPTKFLGLIESEIHPLPTGFLSLQ